MWETVQAAEGQTEGDTESKVGSRLWVVRPEPDPGLELMNHEIMTWAEVRRLTDWATWRPQNFLLFKKSFIYLFWERKREREREGERGRQHAQAGEGQRTPSRLYAVSEEHGTVLNLRNCEIMTWVDIKSWMLNQLSHPGAPQKLSYN